MNLKTITIMIKKMVKKKKIKKVKISLIRKIKTTKIKIKMVKISLLIRKIKKDALNHVMEQKQVRKKYLMAMLFLY